MAALSRRLEGDEEIAAIVLQCAGHGLHRRILADDVHEFEEFRLHGIERRGLVAANAAVEAAFIGLREEAARDDGVKVDVEEDGDEQGRHHGAGIVQRPGQGAAIEVQAGLEAAPRRPHQAAFLFRVGEGNIGAHHRRDGERNHQRDEDGDGQHHGEFMEDLADDAGEEQDRDEHRHQRDAHRHHGEGNFAGADQGGFQPGTAVLEMAGDVLQHHDGIVDHKAGGDDQGHQREIVQAVAGRVHQAERAHQRQRHRDGGHRRRRQVAQEEIDHQHHKERGKQQRHFNVAHRIANGDGGVLHHQDGVDRRRQRFLQGWQDRLDAVDHLDDVAAGLLGDADQHRRLAVGDAHVLGVFLPVKNLGHIGEAHRRIVAVGDNQIAEIRRVGGIVVGIDLDALAALFDGALGAVGAGIGGGDRTLDSVEIDAVLEDRARVELDAHRRLGGALRGGIADARNLRQALLQQVGG